MRSKGKEFEVLDKRITLNKDVKNQPVLILDKLLQVINGGDAYPCCLLCPPGKMVAREELSLWCSV